jgi:hypothetical protein
MSAELEILSASAERLFSDHVTPDLFRRAAAGEWPEDLWAAVTAAGFERAEMSEFGVTIARIAGRFAAPIPLAETILAGALLARAGLPVPGGVLTFATGDRLTGAAKHVPWARNSGHIVIACGETLVLVETGRCEISPGVNIAGEPRDDVCFAAAPITEMKRGVSAAAAYEQAALLRAAQIAGGLERILAMTVQYAAERRQFGRPIAKFQAVQHHLAALAGHTAAASAAVQAAALAPDFLTIAAAKSCASEAAGEGAAIAHQVHGAIGFTAEHSLHRHTKTLWAWRDEYGSEVYWNTRLGGLFAARGGDGLWPEIVGSRG